MFEQSVLDGARTRRSGWSWMGLVVQAALVGGVFVAPMVRPELLEVILPKALVYVPVKAVAPVEVEVRTAGGPAGAGPAVARPAYRVFRAPSGRVNPVATIVDAPGLEFAPFVLGGPRVSADSGPIVDGSGGLPGIGVLAPPPPPPAKAEGIRTIRVGGNVQAANLLHRVNPVYPALARNARIQGLVRLEGVVAKDGTVQRLRVLSGHPLLAPAALEAVSQWRYRPTFLNGDPVEVIAPIDVSFVLAR